MKNRPDKKDLFILRVISKVSPCKYIKRPVKKPSSQLSTHTNRFLQGQATGAPAPAFTTNNNNARKGRRKRK
jgi:hypothetical protein